MRVIGNRLIRMEHDISPSTYSERLIGWPELIARVPLSRTTIWNLRKVGQFPDPIAVTKGRVVWRESDINRWIQERAASGADR